jgi:hypothetical protein
MRGYLFSAQYGRIRMASRRGTRKAGKKSGGKTRKAGSWAQLVKKVYQELKRKNKNASLGDAMKEASRRRR